MYRKIIVGYDGTDHPRGMHESPKAEPTAEAGATA